jgi:hypothetical protein
MRILTFIGLFWALAATTALAQAPANDRLTVHQEQLAGQEKFAWQQVLEEKRARLTEAISDADLESAQIMQQETLEVMEKVLLSGAEAKEVPLPILERMQAIRDELRSMPLDTLGEASARKAGSLVSEFLALMERATF